MKKLFLVILVIALASFLFVGCLPVTPSEGEGEGLRPRVEKLDFEGALADFTALAHELVETLRVDDSRAGGIDVTAVVAGRRLAVQGHAEPNRTT